MKVQSYKFNFYNDLTKVVYFGEIIKTTKTTIRVHLDRKVITKAKDSMNEFNIPVSDRECSEEATFRHYKTTKNHEVYKNPIFGLINIDK